uniref:Uncharacterized protein n=1 Tax=viral metagenome TaxID=1070528 RepID=A0A6C0ADQ3_9ZZZZ
MCKKIIFCEKLISEVIKIRNIYFCYKKIKKILKKYILL